MNKIEIKVELLFLEWDELHKYVGTNLIIYNALKPWIGFNTVYLSEIANIGGFDVVRINTQELAFNKISITKDKYLVEYFLTDNLMWHRK
jgi:hypothetical protein